MTQGVTLTHCVLLKIETVGGDIFGMTDLDEDIDYDSVIYKTAVGATPSSFKSDNQLSVNTAELDGVIDVLGITRTNLENGLFDFASITQYRYDYVAESMLEIITRGYWGESKLFKGHYIAELRSLSQRLQEPQGDLLSPTCRAALGDGECGIDIETDPNAAKQTGTVNGIGLWTGDDVGKIDYGSNNCSLGVLPGHYTTKWIPVTPGQVLVISVRGDDPKHYAQTRTGGVCSDIALPTDADGTITMHAYTVPAGVEDFRLYYSASDNVNRRVFVHDQADPTSGLRKDFQSDDFAHGEKNSYRYGVVEWLTGDNTGATMEVVESDIDGSFILFESMYAQILPGDTFSVYRGCDRTVLTCEVVFDNVINFRGEPGIPGQDAILLFGGQGKGHQV